MFDAFDEFIIFVYIAMSFYPIYYDEYNRKRIPTKRFFFIFSIVVKYTNLLKADV